MVSHELLGALQIILVALSRGLSESLPISGAFQVQHTSETFGVDSWHFYVSATHPPGPRVLMGLVATPRSLTQPVASCLGFGGPSLPMGHLVTLYLELTVCMACCGFWTYCLLQSLWGIVTFLLKL